MRCGTSCSTFAYASFVRSRVVTRQLTRAKKKVRKEKKRGERKNWESSAYMDRTSSTTKRGRMCEGFAFVIKRRSAMQNSIYCTFKPVLVTKVSLYLQSIPNVCKASLFLPTHKLFKQCNLKAINRSKRPPLLCADVQTTSNGTTKVCTLLSKLTIIHGRE